MGSLAILNRLSTRIILHSTPQPITGIKQIIKKKTCIMQNKQALTMQSQAICRFRKFHELLCQDLRQSPVLVPSNKYPQKLVTLPNTLLQRIARLNEKENNQKQNKKKISTSFFRTVNSPATSICDDTSTIFNSDLFSWSIWMMIRSKLRHSSIFST